MAAHVGDDRYAAGQTDLAPVGVAREVQAEAGLGCHVCQFRGMDEGDLEALGCSFERRPSRVRVVVMDVVGSRDVNLRPAPSDGPGLVDQNVDAEGLEGLHHVGAVVVAEDRIDPMPGPQSGKESFEARQDVLEGTGDPTQESARSAHRKTCGLQNPIDFWHILWSSVAQPQYPGLSAQYGFDRLK